MAARQEFLGFQQRRAQVLSGVAIVVQVYLYLAEPGAA